MTEVVGNNRPSMSYAVFLSAAAVAWWRESVWACALRRILPLQMRRQVYTHLQRVIFGQRVTSAIPREFQWMSSSKEAVSITPSQFDVRVFGYLGGTSGLAAAARRYFGALETVGTPVTLHDLKTRHLPEASATGRGVDLIVANPDNWDAVRHVLGPRCGRLRLACWFWELETAPDTWHEAAKDVDALMLASDFMADAFAAFELPRVYAPVPIEMRRVADISRDAFNLPPDAFVFLTAVDFCSVAARKNPIGAIHAFRRAFPDGAMNVVLAVKCSNARAYPTEFVQLLKAANGDRRVHFIDAQMSDIQVAALRECSDAFLSLHRSEGFGLMIAECMGLGKPAIATGWSGNLIFMNQDNSFLVPYAMHPVPSGAYPHAHGSWAEPDIDCAANVMRRLVQEPALASSIGTRAALDIERLLSPAAIGIHMADALSVLLAQATHTKRDFPL